MSRLLLTEQERHRFADWLEMEAASSEGLALELDKLFGGSVAAIAKQHRMEAAASRLIAKKLRSIESMTIGRASEGE